MRKMKPKRNALLHRLARMAGTLVAFAATGASADTVTARAAVDAQSVFVGEAFRFQIQVSGSESPDKPDLSALENDFAVEEIGGRVNSSSSVTIINGRMTKNVQKGFIFDYKLTPKREGRFVIPLITVKADGQTARVGGIPITAQKPVEAENFKLRVMLSKEVAYVGEPIIAEIVFYYNADVRNTELSAPFLDDDAFHYYDLDRDNAKRAEKLDGQQFQTIRLRKALIPKRAGDFQFEPATLAFQGVSGFRNARDFFGRVVREPTYKRFVIPSNASSLAVRELPTEGRPPNFAGHVGEFEISASATPTEVNVGDPITLNITLSGPPYLEHIDLPPLHQQSAFKNAFRIPKEREAGKVNGQFKIFTQTIRALAPSVSAIPPIELAYFDTAAGTYKTAASNAIPLVVRATKVVTANDAEGLAPVTGNTSEVQAWTRGIAHNYEDLDALEGRSTGLDSMLRSPAWIAGVGAPPALYLALFLFLFSARKRHSDPDVVRSRKAFSQLHSRLGGTTTSTEVLDALRSYLGDKLALTSGALTFNDLRAPLENKGADPETVAEIKQLFEECEAIQYAGGGSGDDATTLATRCENIARTLEKQLR